mmetsp:Transcript_60250/g.99735  ORF Transcript_60250/g.99735 Transcript_60250/m.99735 type:complete len:252 (-) Transcript_60250:268-1023(-)
MHYCHRQTSTSGAANCRALNAAQRHPDPRSMVTVPKNVSSNTNVAFPFDFNFTTLNTSWAASTPTWNVVMVLDLATPPASAMLLLCAKRGASTQRVRRHGAMAIASATSAAPRVSQGGPRNMRVSNLSAFGRASSIPSASAWPTNLGPASKRFRSTCCSLGLDMTCVSRRIHAGGAVGLGQDGSDALNPNRKNSRRSNVLNACKMPSACFASSFSVMINLRSLFIFGSTTQSACTPSGCSVVRYRFKALRV